MRLIKNILIILLLLAAYPAAASDSALIQQWQRDYDTQGRELEVRHRIGSAQWQILSQKSYDAVGRLSAETFGNAETGIERTYTYDIRSNPVSISSYGYSQTLTYTFGGLVSTMTWEAYGPHELQRKYTYQYDALSRLTSAAYEDAEGNEGHYDTAYTYDLNGNITTLSRMGLYDSSPYRTTHGLIDNLTYEYRGNQVTRISDSCTGPYYQGAYHFRDGADETVEYLYDANGNMITDLNRGIFLMRYDHNNRPKEIRFASGARTAYIYSADGVKLQTLHNVPTVAPSVNLGDLPADDAVTTVTDYCGPFVYEDGKLARINLENGYINYLEPSGRELAQPEHVFYLRDHLGNNRVSVRGKDRGILQIDHYYPFGLPMGCGYSMAFQRWRFGNKEFDRTAGLDLYDFDARAYDPSAGRFFSPDPLAEKYFPHSPFAYCANNPLLLIDPTGKIIETLWDIGNVIYDVSLAISNHIEGNHKAALNNWVDAAVDVACAFIPFVPGGMTKAAKVTDKVIDVTSNVAKGEKTASTTKKASEVAKKIDTETATFIQGTGEKAKKITVELPEGYHILESKARSHGQKIYTNDKDFITPDKDGHNGGIWKKANKLDDLLKNKRTGTYDKNLKKIGK